MSTKLVQFKSIASLLVVLFLCFSCQNKVEQVRLLTQDERIPTEVQKNLDVLYTDSTYKRLTLKAPVAESYPNLAEPQREFPEGIEVVFFDNYGNQSSSLTSQYALQLINKSLWEARGDVVVINTKGEQLNTEKLFWDSQKEVIYSNDFVKITTPEQVIMGEGFTADQGFNNYEISRVTGTINIEDDA